MEQQVYVIRDQSGCLFAYESKEEAKAWQKAAREEDGLVSFMAPMPRSHYRYILRLKDAVDRITGWAMTWGQDNDALCYAGGGLDAALHAELHYSGLLGD
jgi:hypothetical protein